MFARILEFEVKLEKKEEFVKKVKNEVLPILRKQVGFLEILPFFPENVREEKGMSIQPVGDQGGCAALREGHLSQNARNSETLPDHAHHSEALRGRNHTV